MTALGFFSLGNSKKVISSVRLDTRLAIHPYDRGLKIKRYTEHQLLQIMDKSGNNNIFTMEHYKAHLKDGVKNKLLIESNRIDLTPEETSYIYEEASLSSLEQLYKEEVSSIEYIEQAKCHDKMLTKKIENFVSREAYEHALQNQHNPKQIIEAFTMIFDDRFYDKEITDELLDKLSEIFAFNDQLYQGIKQKIYTWEDVVKYPTKFADPDFIDKIVTNEISFSNFCKIESEKESSELAKKKERIINTKWIDISDDGETLKKHEQSQNHFPPR